MNTSYYAKSARHINAVAISLIVPEWFKGRQYRKLAPSWDIFNNWKKNGSVLTFIMYNTRDNPERPGFMKAYCVTCERPFFVTL